MDGYSGLLLNQATTSSTSTFINTYNLTNISAVTVSSGTMVGTVKFQVSNDFDISGDLSQFVPTNWADLSVNSTNTIAGTVSVLPQVVVSYHYMRAVFSASTGIGTISVYVKGNGY